MAAWEPASARFFGFLFPPSKSQLAVPRGLHVPDCLPTAVGTVQKCCRWACGCVQMSVRACGGLCVGGTAAPGKWRGAGSGLCLWGFRWSLRTCGWLSICLPLLVAFCFLSLRLTTLAELQDKLPPQAPPLLSPQLPLLPLLEGKEAEDWP